MTPLGAGYVTFGIGVIFVMVTAAIGALAGLGIVDEAVLSIVGGGVFYAAMLMVDSP